MVRAIATGVARATVLHPEDPLLVHPDAGSAARGGLPARGGPACRIGQSAGSRGEARGGTTPLAVGEYRIRCDQEWHGSGTRAGGAIHLGTRSLFAGTADRAMGALPRRAADSGEIRKDIGPAGRRACCAWWMSWWTDSRRPAGEERAWHRGDGATNLGPYAILVVDCLLRHLWRGGAGHMLDADAPSWIKAADAQLHPARRQVGTAWQARFSPRRR